MDLDDDLVFLHDDGPVSPILPAQVSAFQCNLGGFKCILQNIRSVCKNFEEFQLFLDNGNLDFDMVCLTEAWLNMVM